MLMIVMLSQLLGTALVLIYCCDAIS